MRVAAHVVVAAAAVIGVCAVVAVVTATAAEAAAPMPAPSPVPMPSPVPVPSPSVSGDLPSTGGTGIGFGFGDWITGQINSWFANLVYLAIKPLLDLLAVTLLATPDVAGSGRVFDLWKANAAIANTGFVLLATIGAISAMGHQTVQTRYAVKEVLPRLCIAVLAANTSFLLCGKVIEIANALSTALLGQDFDGHRAAATLQLWIIAPGMQHQIFFILLALVAVILLLLLLVTFVMRAALILLLTVASPLALACLALPYTDGLTRFWWRAFCGLLLIQVAQSLTLVLAVRIFFNQDGRLLLGIAPTGQLVNLILALCLLIILIRIPGWISRRIFAQTGGRGWMVTRMIKYALAYKLTSPVLNALHLGRGGRGRASRSSGAAGSVAAHAMAGKAIAGRALPALAAAGSAAAAARGGAGPVKHAPVSARRPVNPADWEPAPVKHAPSAPAVQGKYRMPPRPSAPVPRTTPVYGYPREAYYANGPAGLAQMARLRNPSTPPPTSGQSARPIVPPGAPTPGSVDWPENPGARRKPPRRGRPSGSSGGGGR
ncbi:conjugal transfer protein TrbL family protein [Sphaerimonospora sp. CA-214678]|uniref:conjugal transfer protein TrbL family protein n=1 Tax=Sphaerimonospora sp. CA-214678 TaxID=3240029 RepID=UPI003D903AC7